MKAKTQVYAVLALNPVTNKLVVISASGNPEAAKVASLLAPPDWQIAPMMATLEVETSTPDGQSYELAQLNEEAGLIN